MQQTEHQAPASNRAMRRQQQREAGRRRRPAKVRPVMVNTIEYVKNRATRLTDEERAAMLAPARDGFKALREGVATFEQWGAVATAVTVGVAIEDQGIVAGMRGHFQEAKRALHAVWQRVECSAPDGAAWGRSTALYFDEIAAIREILHLHDFQLQQLAISELHAAIDSIRGAVRTGSRFVIHASMPVPAPAPPVQERLA